MRPRKAAIAPSHEEISPRDDTVDLVPLDDARSDEGDAEPCGRICIACGGEGSGHEGCAHGEIAELTAPSRAAREAVARLRHAAAEHRAATRALRVLVLSEMARGQAELHLHTQAAPALPLAEPAACPRCALRDAEASAPRPARRKARSGQEQQSLRFAGDPGHD